MMIAIAIRIAIRIAIMGKKKPVTPLSQSHKPRFTVSHLHVEHIHGGLWSVNDEDLSVAACLNQRWAAEIATLLNEHFGGGTWDDRYILLGDGDEGGDGDIGGGIYTT